MKRFLSFVLAALLLTGLTACGSAAQTETKGTQSVTAGQKETEKSTSPAGQETVRESEAVSEASSVEITAATEKVTQAPAAHSDTLVAFFSATGTTKRVAEMIAAITGGDLYEIVPAKPYSDADLNWNDRNSRSTKEQNDKNVRPEIGSEDISLEGYTTVYLGFPIWWGEEPRILDTFVTKYSLEGITVIPFCMSASSGIGRSGPNMEALAGSGTWLAGKRFGGNVSETDLKSWIEGLKK